MQNFVDDTKSYAVVNKAEEGQTLQRDIDRLVQWPNDWPLKFNPTKCKHVLVQKSFYYKLQWETVFINFSLDHLYMTTI